MSGEGRKEARKEVWPLPCSQLSGAEAGERLSGAEAGDSDSDVAFGREDDARVEGLLVHEHVRVDARRCARLPAGLRRAATSSRTTAMPCFERAKDARWRTSPTVRRGDAHRGWEAEAWR